MELDPMSMAATRRWPGATERRVGVSRTSGMTVDTRHASLANSERSKRSAARGATDTRNIDMSLDKRAALSPPAAEQSSVTVVEPIELALPVERQSRASRAVAQPAPSLCVQGG